MSLSLLAHRINFYDYQPSPFTCLARSHSGLLAAGRSDGSIDIYDENRNFFMIAHIPKSVGKSVMSVAWIDSRLFSTGAVGLLMEFNLNSMCLKSSTVLVGSPVARCLTAYQSKLMVGTDEGFVSVYSTDTFELTLEKTFPKFSGKILAIACEKLNYDIIAVGTSNGTLHVLSLSDGNSLTRFTLTEAASSCVIWALLFVRGTLFSGDSRGIVSVWDVSVGGLLFSFAAHRADVLTLSSSLDGNTVFSAGVDATIRRIEFCKSEDGQTVWQMSGILRGCKRDVHGLAFTPGQHYNPASETSHSDSRFEPHRLVAVGQDARLQILSCEQTEKGVEGLARAAHTLPTQVGRPRSSPDGDVAHVAALPFWSASISPTHPAPINFVTLPEGVQHAAFPKSANRLHLCLLHYPHKLSLVRLGRPADDTEQKFNVNSKFIPMILGPHKFADIHHSKGMEFISTALSSCGSYIAYSDLVRTRILRIGISARKYKKSKFRPPVYNVSIKPVDWLDPCIDNSKINNIESEFKLNNSNTQPYSSNFYNFNKICNISSSETDTDTDDFCDSRVSQFFALDQSSIPSQSENRKRKYGESSDNNNENSAYNSDLDSNIFATENENFSGFQTLPAAHCLSFTDDSEKLLLVTQNSGDLLCINVSTGSLLWKSVPVQDNGLPTRAYIMSITKRSSPIGYIVAVGCTDARVRLYNSVNGLLLFTTSCHESLTEHIPLPVQIIFSPKLPELVEHDDESELTVNFSILYTNSQLREWFINMKISNINEDLNDSNIEIKAKFNKWLNKFCRIMGDEILKTVGVFHSLNYFDTNSWLLATDRYLIMLISNKSYEPGLFHNLLSKKTTLSHLDSCVKITKSFQSILQASVLNDKEIAVVSIYSPKVDLKLCAPMQKKYFKV